MIDVALAFLAGVVTVAAPCILPMLPILFGASVGQTSRARPLFIALGFATTFSAVAIAFGLFADALGLSHEVLRNVAIVLLVTFGAAMIWRAPFDRLMARFSRVLDRAHAIGQRASTGNTGGFVLGATLGVLWTPCAGPVLGSILTLIATAHDVKRAFALLAFYAAGASLPMLAIAYGGQYVSTHVRRVVPYTHRLQQTFGILVLALAVAMYFQYDTLLTAWLSSAYPSIQSRLW